LSGQMSDKNPIANNHEELIVWQLCAQLRRLVLNYTRRGPARSDVRFRSQIRGAARSACYLVSEGFYRKRDGDFLNLLVFSRGELGEVSDQVGEGHEHGYFTDTQRDEMITMVKRACGANGGLRRYLESQQKQKTPPKRAGRAPRWNEVKWTWRRYAPRPRNK
jgi:four helix bundle protein